MMNVEHTPIDIGRNQPCVSAVQATEILGGFKVDTLVRQHFITPRYSGRGTAFDVTANDVIRAFRIKTIKEDNHLRLWSDIKSHMLTPYTEERLRAIETHPDWEGVLRRAADFGLNLTETIASLRVAAKTYRTNSR